MPNIEDPNHGEAVAKLMSRTMRPAPYRWWRSFDAHVADRMSEEADRRGVHPKHREELIALAWMTKKKQAGSAEAR
jgi:hypothetical protein